MKIILCWLFGHEWQSFHSEGMSHWDYIVYGHDCRRCGQAVGDA